MLAKYPSFHSVYLYHVFGFFIVTCKRVWSLKNILKLNQARQRLKEIKTIFAEYLRKLKNSNILSIANSNFAGNSKWKWDVDGIFAPLPRNLLGQSDRFWPFKGAFIRQSLSHSAFSFDILLFYSDSIALACLDVCFLHPLSGLQCIWGDETTRRTRTRTCGGMSVHLFASFIHSIR